MAARDDVELVPATLGYLAANGIKGIRAGSLSLPQLTALAASVGARVESEDGGSEYRECEVFPPAGHCWSDEGVHVLLSVAEWGQVPFRPSYNDLANRMAEGFERCDCEECIAARAAR